MKINQEQIKAVLALPADKRYLHFTKVVCAWEKVWGLYDNGWAMAATDEGQQVFPVWPLSEYAQLCVKDEWKTFLPKSFTLDEFIETILPTLKLEEISPGVFYTPNDKGIVVSVDQLQFDLDKELEKYL